MAIIQDWMPPTREHYDQILFLWQFFPLFASLQWAISWYGMGKTSVNSRFNLPGRIGWLTMECPGFLTLLYLMRTLPRQEDGTSADLPWQNRVLAAFFVMHYAYRAVLFPLLQPSMSPMHVLVWAAGLAFQLANATCLGGWLAAYGPATAADWDAALAPFGAAQFCLGAVVWFAGLLANYYHDDELREIRRRVLRRQKKAVVAVDKLYELPQAGLFRYVLYPHYLAEWVEWAGFWLACGWGCAPARMFLVNEVVAMLPRAVRGRRWYVERFGEDKVGRRRAVIPGLL